MSYPFLQVSIDFDHGPWDTTSTWTDVTSYVRGGPMQISYGRDKAVDDFQPGTCRFTLANHDGRFDPANTAGPYYGRLKPRRRMKVTSAHGLWYGYITGWPQRRDWRNLSWVDISAVDALSMLAQIEMPESIWRWKIQQYIDAGDVWSWWRMGDTTEVATDASGNGAHGTWRVWENSNDPAGGLPAPKAVMDAGRAGPVIPATVQAGSNFAAMQAAVGQPLGGTGTNTPRTVSIVGPPSTGIVLISAAGWSVEVWGIFRQAFPVSVNGAYSATVPIYTDILAWGAPGSVRFELSLHPSGGYPVFWVSDGLGTDSGWTIAAGSLYDGQPHQIVVTFDPSHNLKLYVDGSIVWTLPAFNDLQPSQFPLVVNSAQGGTSPRLLESTLGDVVLYQTALTASQVTLNWYAGRYGRWVSTTTTMDTSLAFVQATSVVPINGLAKTVNFSDGLAVDPGPGGGGSVLDYLRKVNASEQGLLYADKDGTLQFWGRSWPAAMSRARTVQYRFIDSPTVLGTEHGYAQLIFGDGQESIENDVTVTSAGGEQHATSAASQADYGPIRGQVDTFLSSAEDAQQLANFRVWRNGQPPSTGSYPDRLVIDLVDADATMASFLDIGTRISVSYTSLANPATLIVDEYWVQSVAHSIDVGEGPWQITLGLAPADDPASPFIFDTSTFDGADSLWL